MPNYKDIIAREEREFPRVFADVAERGYGLLFYNEDTKTSHDSNHAVLNPEKITDLGAVLDEIRDFYLSKNIVPRIYGRFEENAEMFNSRGWKVNTYGDYRIMLLTEPCKIDAPERLNIRRLTEWDERLAYDILLPDEDEVAIEVLKRSLAHSGNYLFAGYFDGAAVVYVSLHTAASGCTRFDDIVTAPNRRGRGYARELMRYVTDFCRDEKFPLCYQWPAHETSERMSYNAGFRYDFSIPAGSAVYERRN